MAYSLNELVKRFCRHLIYTAEALNYESTCKIQTLDRPDTVKLVLPSKGEEV